MDTFKNEILQTIKLAKIIFGISIGSGNWAVTYRWWVIWHYVASALKISMHFDPMILRNDILPKQPEMCTKTYGQRESL